jgi:hypothetical protein
VGFYLYAQFLEVLYYRAIDGTAKVSVLIGNNTSLVPDAIVYILKTAFTQELISGTEWYLNDGGELCHFFCSIILDICNTLNDRLGMLERNRRAMVTSK